MISTFLQEKWLFTVVLPSICLIGVAGSLTGAIVIRKCGLKKPSNCLLLALAISDFCHCLAKINPPGALLYHSTKLPVGLHRWEMSYMWAFTCFIFYQIMSFISGNAARSATAITVLITVERLIAIFVPLHFNKIVTTRRMWVAVGASVLFWIPWETYRLVNTQFYYNSSLVYNIHAGGLKRNPDINQAMYWFIHKNVMSHLHHTIPLVFVSTGCICIGFKIHFTTLTSRKLKKGSTPALIRFSRQTSRTMISVCGFFCITRIIYSACRLVFFINEERNISSKYLTLIVQSIAEIIIPINSAFNFLVYILTNKRFKAQLLNMVRKGGKDNK